MERRPRRLARLGATTAGLTQNYHGYGVTATNNGHAACQHARSHDFLILKKNQLGR
jgi:hypothetical protein